MRDAKGVRVLLRIRRGMVSSAVEPRGPAAELADGEYDDAMRYIGPVGAGEGVAQ
jgi:hypothetical protein